MIPAGSTAGNFVAGRQAEWDVGLWSGRWDLCVCTPWITWAVPGSKEVASGRHPSIPSPPSMLAGIFQRSSRRQNFCQIRKEFGPNYLEISTYGFFFYSPSFSLGCEDLQGAWPQPASLGALPPHTTSQRQEFSPEIPLSHSLLPLLQVSKEVSPFKFSLHYLEFGFINYLHLVPIKKVEQCRCPDFSTDLREKHQICGFSLSP